MFLSDFHTIVDSFANEGGSQDSKIPQIVRQAAMTLERNYNFEYMKVQVTKNFPASADPAPVSLGKFVKGILSGEAREVGSTEGIKKVALTKDPHAILDDEEFEGKLPVLRYVSPSGETFVKPLLPLSESIDIHFWTVERTANWPVAAPYTTYEHPLIDIAEDVLLATAMLKLSAVTRDPELKAFYEGEFQTGIKTLIDNDLVFTLEE